MAKARELKTPFRNLLPPLSTEEKDALRASIAVEGVRDPVVVDEDDNVLDGHHRLDLAPDAPVKVLKGLTEAEKKAFVIQCNLTRRNLSSTQKAEVRERQKAIAKALREENPKKNTLKQVAALLGVHLDTVSGWLQPPKQSGTISESRKTSATSGGKPKPRPDARMKVSPEAKPKIAEKVKQGELVAQVAADLGVTERTVRSIVSKETKQAEAKTKRQEAAARSDPKQTGIHLGDFRKVGNIVVDGTVDLIFTDPPYDEAAVSLYGDLACFASRVLRPGGWCLAYTGQSFLPQVLSVMAKHLEYGWTFAIFHSGGDLRFRKLKLHNKWKPIVGFYKPSLSAWWDWFPDVASGGREKDSHEWQQALSEAEHFICNLSPKGGLVCDPFVGSGTSCLAAKNLGRKWIGFDTDKEAVAEAIGKVA